MHLKLYFPTYFSLQKGKKMNSRAIFKGSNPILSPTPPRIYSISGLEIDIFELKMMVKSSLEIFILKFSEPLQRYVPANWPGQFSLSVQIVLHWAAATLKGLAEFQNKKF